MWDVGYESGETGIRGQRSEDRRQRLEERDFSVGAAFSRDPTI
jgi:hypothetical protein